MSNVKLSRYVVPSSSIEGGWGLFVIGSDGYFSTVSDYGNYAFRWTAIGGGDFRSFLCGLSGDYLLGKIAPHCWQYDGKKTVEHIREHICMYRRSGDYSKEEAREEWELLDSHDDLAERENFHDWLSNTKISDAWEMACQSFAGDAQAFADRLWPRFIALLKAEMAAEKTLVAEVSP